MKIWRETTFLKEEVTHYKETHMHTLIATHSATVPLVSLVKLGEDRSNFEIEMGKVEIIESILDILPEAPSYLCVALTKLLPLMLAWPKDHQLIKWLNPSSFC